MTVPEPPSETMTVIYVHIIGGVDDGWHGRISVPQAEEMESRIRIHLRPAGGALKDGKTKYNVRRQGGRIFLVHPESQRRADFMLGVPD